MNSFTSKKIKWIFVIGFLMIIIAVLIHELGHIIAGFLLGRELSQILLFGIQFYPSLEVVGFSSGYIGYIEFTYYSLNQTASGLFLMAGAGTTLLLSIIWITLLYLIKTNNFLIKTILIYGSLWHLDIVTYSFGLRFSEVKEPLVAAQALGIPAFVWYALMFLVLIGFNFSLVYYFLFFNREKEYGIAKTMK